MEFTVKKATTQNLAVIQSLNRKLFLSDSRFDPELLIDWAYSKTGKNYLTRSLTQPRAGAWIAEANGKIIGYLIGWIWIKRAWRPIKTAELENMFVLPEYRSKGVGSALVKEFIRWCEKKKIKSVEVWTQYKNEIGKQFYQTNKFVPVSQKFERKLK
ncbi:MAG: GNAT family N-acetyltransferase [Patescibacteria group bacterium]